MTKDNNFEQIKGHAGKNTLVFNFNKIFWCKKRIINILKLAKILVNIRDNTKYRAFGYVIRYKDIIIN